MGLPGGGDPEIHHLHPAAGREHDVAGLDVPVDDPDPVGDVQPVGHARRDPGRLQRRQGPAAAQSFGQRLALEQLEDEERGLAVHEVEHPDHIGVVQHGRGPGLAAEAPHRHRVVGQLLGEDLDRHPPAQQCVVGLPDLAHAARVDPLHGLEAVVLTKLLLHRSLPLRKSLTGERPSNHP
jgi:hypothetical protein